MKKHSSRDIAHAASLFFRVRGLVRQKLAQGRKLDPFAWLHIETLIYIRDHKGPSMHAVADYLSITAPSATSLVAALRRAGLVACHADPRDKRAARLALTVKGKKVLERSVARGTRILGEIFAPLSVAELAGLMRALSNITGGAGK